MMIRGLVLLLLGLPRAANGQGCTMLNLGAHVTNINSACCAGGCDGNGMPADCSLSCAGPFLQFAQECQSIIAAMPIAGELNALVDKCHAAGGVASGGCPCGDVAQKAEVDSLRERLANRDATIDHLSGLLQMVGERMEGVEARVHLLEMEESQLGQNHCLARVNPDDPTAPSTMSGTNGDIDAYCTDECPCGEGEGDCDTSSQCAGGLVCEEEHVLRVGRACPSWMRPDAECCYNIGHASGRDQCAGLSEGAPCDDANAATTDDQCHEGQCGGWQSFPTVIESQQQKAAWLSCEAERHAKLSDVGPDNGGWLGVDLENCGDCYPEYPKYLSEDNTHRHGDIWMPLTAVSYVACHFPDVEYIDWRPGHSVGNSLGRSLFVYTYGPSHDGSDGNTPLGVIRSETFGCSQTQVEPCGHSVLGYDTIELFVISEGSCATKTDGAYCDDGNGDTTRDECRWGRCGGWQIIDSVVGSEEDRLEWLHADPQGIIARGSADGTVDESCTECSLPGKGGAERNSYPKYLYLGGQHDSDEVTQQTVASYMAWRYPDVQYEDWTPGTSVGDQRANTLFVLRGRIRSESQTQVIGHDTLEVFVFGQEGGH